MEVKTRLKCGIPKRKTAEALKICAKNERNASLKKIATILRKSDSEKTPEDLNILTLYADEVSEVQLRLSRRSLAKERLQEIEDPPHILDEKCKKLAQAIRNAQHLVIYTGAGISTAACIPDYRGTNGIWTRLQQGKEIGNHDLSLAEPTYTHMALSELYHRKTLKYIVSQNCDGLHLRSGLPRSALSEVHGNMYIEVCKHCKPNREYWRLFDVTEHTARYSHRTMRRCYFCNNPLIDTIVHFGERGTLQWPLNWPGACKHANKADVIICLGSSLKVLKKYPWLWQMDKPAKKRPNLYIVNLQWTPKDDYAVLKVNGKCDEAMKLVMKELEIDVPEYKRSCDPIFIHASPLSECEIHTTTQPIMKGLNDTDFKCEKTNKMKVSWMQDEFEEQKIKIENNTKNEQADEGENINNNCDIFLVKPKNEDTENKIDSSESNIETVHKNCTQKEVVTVIEEKYCSIENSVNFMCNINFKKETDINCDTQTCNNQEETSQYNNTLYRNTGLPPILKHKNITNEILDLSSIIKIKNNDENTNERCVQIPNVTKNENLKKKLSIVTKSTVFETVEKHNSLPVNKESPIKDSIFAMDNILNPNIHCSSNNLRSFRREKLFMKTNQNDKVNNNNCGLDQTKKDSLKIAKSRLISQNSTKTDEENRKNMHNIFSAGHYSNNFDYSMNIQMLMAYYQTIATTMLHNQMQNMLNTNLYPYQTYFLYPGLHSIINPMSYFNYDYTPQNNTLHESIQEKPVCPETVKEDIEIKEIKNRIPSCSFCNKTYRSYSCLFYIKNEPVFSKTIYRFSKSLNCTKPVYCECCDYTSSEDEKVDDDKKNKSENKCRKRSRNEAVKISNLNETDSDKMELELLNDSYDVSLDSTYKLNVINDEIIEENIAKPKIQPGWFGKGYKKSRKIKKR